ncbi:MAG: MMPL family transporter [Planctomycetaceae bacterium]|nr:MMPL family transporter [Planctomycetaceae bacterium]
MVSDFYRRHSSALLLSCLIALPILAVLGEHVTTNNDIEAWLPRNSQIRQDYDSFCRTFGADENILIAFPQPFPEESRLKALAGRLSGLPGVAHCWTRQQVIDAMKSNGVSDHAARERLINLLTTSGDELETILVSLNREGTANRGETVREVNQQLRYCRLGTAICAGGPVVGTRLDNLGSRKRASTLFGLTLLVCFTLLFLNIACWKTSAALMVGNVFAIQLTLASMWMLDMEMNFVMSSLPVMVMVFTTAAAVHFIGHYNNHFRQPDAVAQAIKGVLRPSLFAAITTVIGLISLSVSDIGPIPMFGVGAAIGTIYSFLCGIFLTPAILLAVGYRPQVSIGTRHALSGWAMLIVNRPLVVLMPGVLATMICCVGLGRLRSLIDPLEFLPPTDQVVLNTRMISEKLTSPTTVETVVDFGQAPGSFIERLREVRRIESLLSSHANVRHTLSVSDFFPEELTEQNLSLSRLSSAAGNSHGTKGLIADGSRLWRISIRLHDDSPSVVRKTVTALEELSAGLPVTFTGIGPLLEHAQGQIFDGFWKSFASAFVLITIVMIIALRSITAGLVAMIPNLTPIVLVFGILGWWDQPIDIGIMMTASIALGLAVDGTFHFLFAYRDCQQDKGCRYRAVRTALLKTGAPIISSALISGTGLLALSLSPFRPTMRFGMLMFFLMVTALAGDLVLLPAFLALGSRRKCLRDRMDEPAITKLPSSRSAA